MQFQVVYADGRADEVRVIPSARRAFETEHDCGLWDAMGGSRSDWADFLVWKTLQLRHGETRSLDEWLLTVDELRLEVPEDPSGGEATHGPATSSKPRARSKSSKR